MVPRDEVIAKMSYDNHKYFKRKKSNRSRSGSLMRNKTHTSISKKSQELSLLESKEYSS